MILRNHTVRSFLLFCMVPVAGIALVSCGKDDPKGQDVSIATSSQEVVTNKIPQGVSVGGVDVSNLSIDEARVQVQSALAAKPTSSILLQLQYNGRTWPVNGAELGITYDIEPALQQALQAAQKSKDELELLKQQPLAIPVPMTLSPTAVDNALAKVASEVNQEAKDASVEFTPEKSERFTYTAGQVGVQMDVAATSQAIQAAFNGNSPTPFAAPVALVVTTVDPQHTIEDMKANTKRIASFSTSFKGNDGSGRVHNIKKGVEKLHGTVVPPGKTFSFNDTTGERSEKNGWEKAATIINGNTFEDDYGGGICQVSTTLYVSLVKSGLKTSERTHHSFPSSYVPKGLDATVDFPSKDLRFTNNTDYPIYITSTFDSKNKEMAVALWGRPLPDGQYIKMRSEVVKEIDPPEPEKVENLELRAGESSTIIKARKGYEVEVYKDTYSADGKVIDSKKMYTDHYPAVQGIIAVGAGGAKASSKTDSIPEEGTKPKETEATSHIEEDSSSVDTTDTSSDDFDIPEELG